MKTPKTLPTPTHPPENFYDAVRTWTNGTLNPRSSYYSGRGPMRGDLSEKHLELIFQGINKDFSPAHAELFVDFVETLTDLAATPFLVAFEYFWGTGCSNAKCYKQQKRDNVTITSHEPNEQFVEGMAGIFATLGNRQSPEVSDGISRGIKHTFLMAHARTIKDKRPSINGGFY